MIILGIESSCDETAAAVVEDGCIIRSSIVSTQIEVHHKYGGVVPELASRMHMEAILPVVIEAIESALGKQAHKEFLPMQPGDVPATFADVEDLTKAVGFKPATPIKEGVGKFISWYRDYYSL